MACPLCFSRMSPVFTAQVLGQYTAQFEHCPACEFLRVSNPHWLEEAYASAIATTDTGLVARNLAIARKLAAFLYCVLPGARGGRFLDEAGGYGLLTRLMRDYGFDFFWRDEYCNNLFAQGFEFEDVESPIGAVTAFEAMEHMIDPATFVREALLSSRSDVFIFTTETYEGNPPAPNLWWYYSLDTGQHISFFSKKSLIMLARTLSMNYFNCLGMHIYSREVLSYHRMSFLKKKTLPIVHKFIKSNMISRSFTDHEMIVARLKMTYGGANNENCI